MHLRFRSCITLSFDIGKVGELHLDVVRTRTARRLLKLLEQFFDIAIQSVLSNPQTSLANTLPRNHHSLSDDSHKVCLRLRTCADVLKEPLPTLEQQSHRIAKILNFFTKVATLNDLGIGPVVKSLKDTLLVLKRGGDLF